VPRGRQKQSSVDKALELLIALGELSSKYRSGVRLSDVDEYSGISAPTAHRLFQFLKAHRFVEQDESNKRYRLGPKIMALSAQLHGGFDLRQRIVPYLTDLARRTMLTAHLAIRDGTQGIYIEKVESRQPIRLASEVGQRVFLHSSALGKAMMAFSGTDVLEAVVAAGLEARTPNTITNGARLAKELAGIRKRGYAVDKQENETGIMCIAAPIFNHRNHVIAAISIAGTVGQVRKQRIPALSRLVRQACRDISESMGFTDLDGKFGRAEDLVYGEAREAGRRKQRSGRQRRGGSLRDRLPHQLRDV
jgi:DNA-binding IclR family transcriptional regulator